ncbi:VOC family protein [Aliikangiella marina]|uniref:VOC family protein n=1 Tax=Aliikangiella marina TaxID=1712262 RepID=A0A545T4W1_9GAMM|nr:VOC family protein [Aliikangiella marina]TQV72269.1 VOC family protein [Aliikangiella marina]
MLRLEHINMVVTDLDQSLKFYHAAFPHWRVRGSGSMDWYGKTKKWLHFGDDYFYLSINDGGEGENRHLKGHSVGLAHIGFVTENLAALIKRLADAGFEVDHGGESKFRNNAYYIDPDGFEIEFVEYLSDLPAERNGYE